MDVRHSTGRPGAAFAIGLTLLVLLHVVQFGLIAWLGRVPAVGPDAETFLRGVTTPPGYTLVEWTALDADEIDARGLRIYRRLIRDGHWATWSVPGGGVVEAVVVRAGTDVAAAGAESGLTLALSGAAPQRIHLPVNGVRSERLAGSNYLVVTGWSENDVAIVVRATSPATRTRVSADPFVEELNRDLQGTEFDAPYIETPGLVLVLVLALVSAGAVIGVLWVVRLPVRQLRGVGARRGRANIDASPEARRLRRVGRVVTAMQFGVLIGVVESQLIYTLWTSRLTRESLTVPFSWAVLVVPPATVVTVAAVAILLLRLSEGRRSRVPRSMVGRLLALGPAAIGVIAISLGLFAFGVSALISGLVAEYYGLLPDLIGWRGPLIWFFFNAVALVSIAVTATLAAVAFRWARLLQVRPARRFTDEIPAEAALLLRSFGDDRARVVTLAGGRHSLTDAWSLRASDRFEEVLAWELSDRWPVAAVTEPGGPRRTLGASRVRLREDQWQHAVWVQMHRCPVVVAVLGDTPGFRWEVVALLRSGALKRTVFVFPPIEWTLRARRLNFLHRTLVDAGMTPPPVPDPESVIALLVDDDLQLTTIGVDRWDEAGYRAALRAAINALASPGTAPLSASAPPASAADRAR